MENQGFAQTQQTVTLDAVVEQQAYTLPDNVFAEKVVSVEHFTDWLFRFRITRPRSFRFRSGEFVMIGLPGSTKPVFRAYSIASPAWDEEIEFYSIKVEGGPLTEHLQKIQPGDTVLMRKKSTGTLVLDALSPGKRLFLLSTGTGIAPFASIIRDPETYEKFDSIIVTHTCRTAAELQYGFDLMDRTQNDPLVGELTTGKLFHFTSTTQEDSPNKGRITQLIEDGSFFSAMGIDGFDPQSDRIMLCGSKAMLTDLKEILDARGFDEGANNRPSSYVVERAFVD